MIRVTNNAIAELERFTQKELIDGEFIRIARAYQCGGSRFQLTVDDVRTNMDLTIELDGVPVVVEQSCLQLLEGCELDYNANGFLFFDPLGNQC